MRVGGNLEESSLLMKITAIRIEGIVQALPNESERGRQGADNSTRALSLTQRNLFSQSNQM